VTVSATIFTGGPAVASGGAEVAWIA